MSNTRAARSAAWRERVAAEPRALQPIPHDEDLPTRTALHRRTVLRGATSAPSPWPRWGLAEAYIAFEIHRTARTLERTANLAVVAAARLGGITITN